MANGAITSWTVLVLLIVAMAVVYFLPIIIGLARDVYGLGVLSLVNVLFGATVIGWLICLFWSIMGRTKAQKLLADRAAAEP